MSYVQPSDLVDRLTAAGASKVTYSTGVTVLRATMAGAIFTRGAAFAVTVSTQTGEPLLGALLFPVGFILLYLMGFDLLTGVFTLVPLAWIARKPGVSLGPMLSGGAKSRAIAPKRTRLVHPSARNPTPNGSAGSATATASVVSDCP